ncbi:uncharacterized protein ACR2FA_009314 [Aphomia sociella]
MSIGKISEFNVRSDNWKLYVERLEQYFVVNKIADELKVPTFITVIGLECYELLVDLCTPDKPAKKTFEQLTSILEKHLQPKPSILAERYKFRQRKQGSSETVSDYVAVLKKLSKTCEFGAWLEDSLRDQFVCGIRCESIRQRLFQEDKLDFSKAYRFAISMEAAEKDAAAVESRTEASRVAECQAVSAWRAAGSARGPAERGRRGAWRARDAARPGPAQPQRGQWCRACGSRHDLAQCKFRYYVCKVCIFPRYCILFRTRN